MLRQTLQFQEEADGPPSDICVYEHDACYGTTYTGQMADMDNDTRQGTDTDMIQKIRKIQRPLLKKASQQCYSAAPEKQKNFGHINYAFGTANKKINYYKIKWFTVVRKFIAVVALKLAVIRARNILRKRAARQFQDL